MTDSRTVSLKEKILAILPESTHLDLSNQLAHKETAEVIDALQQIPKNIVNLDISSNYGFSHWYDIKADDLIRIFAAIPKHITSLNISNNSLGYWLFENEILDLLKAIPAGLKELNLSWNVIGTNSAKWLEFFRTCQQQLNVLDLSHTDLGQLIDEDLIEFLTSIKAPIISLNLSNNCQRHSLYYENFLDIVCTHLAKTVTTLNLSDNDIGSWKIPAAKLSKIPLHITSLDLSDNSFIFNTIDQIGEDISKIPTNITSLSLRKCGLAVKGSAGLATIFTKLPQSITSIDLSDNEFCEIGTQKYIKDLSDVQISDYQNRLIFEHPIDKTISTADFVKAFRLIPHHVRSINLSHNSFDLRSDEELIEIINAIPETIDNIIVEKTSKIFDLIKKCRNITYDTMCESFTPVISAMITSYITTEQTFWNKKNASSKANTEKCDDEKIHHLCVR